VFTMSKKFTESTSVSTLNTNIVSETEGKRYTIFRFRTFWFHSQQAGLSHLFLRHMFGFLNVNFQPRAVVQW